MKQEQIHDALNLLDDDLIEAVDALRDKTKQKIPWTKYMFLAVCMCVVILGLYALKQFNIFRDNNVTNDEAELIDETNSTVNDFEGEHVDDEEKEITDGVADGVVGEVVSDTPISESVIVGEVPSVLVRIDAWTGDGFAGTVAGIADTEIFEAGAQISVVFKDNICVGVPIENGMTFEDGAPDSEDFPTGSIVRVHFTVAFNDEADGSTTGNTDEYVIYAELIAPADTEK